MKERPILFSAPMIRAILEGRKTQTRRMIKPQPTWDGKWFRWDGHAPNSKYGAYGANTLDGVSHFMRVSCPYGLAGDRLWVREAFSGPYCMDPHFGADVIPPSQWLNGSPIWYWADGNPKSGDWSRPRPSIHMPRWASRITLEITGVRVERLQDISETDAEAEGVEALDSEAHCEREEFDHALCGNCGGRRLYDALGPNMGVMPDTDCRECDTHAKRYRWLWEGINGEGSWAANPWVWVVEFRRIEQPA